MQPDASDDAPETRPAGPSVSDPTRTAEPLAPSHSGPIERIPATQLRDPDRYKVLGEHGRGGLGRVTRAHDRDLGRDIAIKELIARSHVSEVRFLREALITARLEHPGIVPVYEAGRWPDGTPFYAMKLVAGRPLRALIAERTTVEDRLGLLHYVIAVADAIAYAHGRNIIHRDLKPANVIVGDFGETIVIDWGLAKDLSAAEEATVAGGPFRSPHDDGLTSTGSVLGTPAYMAPEQGRGEAVDQRADVFAIGAMLWELCSLRKLPPGYSGERGRILRSSSIDPDLATIILKALESDPARRYANASALAADLKAFKAGARIAARRYSLLALLAHWTRRHRTLASAIVAMLGLAVAGTMMYVRGIAAERDRVRAANNTLILEQTRLLLQSDPTAAFELLQTYRGADMTRVELLRAEARGLGIATLHVKPHIGAVYFARLMADGALVSLATDGLVTRTSPSGTTTILARGIENKDVFAYSSRTQVLAFPCEAGAICLLDLRADTPAQPLASTASFSPAGLALSPDGELLAALSDRGRVAVWRLAGEGRPVGQLKTSMNHGETLKFVDDHTLAVRSNNEMRILHLDIARQQWETSGDISIANLSGMSTSSDSHIIAASTTTGHLALIDSSSRELVQEIPLCKDHLNATFILATRNAVGFACQGGDVGIWNLAQRESITVGHIDGGAATIAGSTDGRYLVAGGNTGKLIIYDFTTKMPYFYPGHIGRIFTLSAPSPGFSHILSADGFGEIRLWSLPDAHTRVAIKTTTRIYSAFPFPSDGSVIAIGDSSNVLRFTPAGGSQEVPGHAETHSLMALSNTQRHAVMYGIDDELEVWSFDDRPIKRAITTEHSAAVAVTYTTDATHFAVASRDGSIARWSQEDLTSHPAGTIGEPVVFMRHVRTTDSFIVGGASGALWLVEDTGRSYLGSMPGRIGSVVVSPDCRWFGIANSQGLIHLYDIRSRALREFQSPRHQHEILRFSPDNRLLVVGTDQTVSAIAVSTQPNEWSWSDIELPLKYFYFSPDNHWFAGLPDHGGIWFNRKGSRHWIYVATGTNRMTGSGFSADGREFVAADSGGRVLIVEMANLLDH